MRVAFALLGLLLLVPAAAAGTPRVFMLHDTMDDGYTFSGNLNQFAWALLEEEGKTQVHKNAKIRLIQDGKVVYETLGGKGFDTAHDYDALNPIMYRFLHAGNYTVQAEVNVSAGLSLSSEFNGTIVDRHDLVAAEIATIGAFPTTASVNRLTPFKFQIQGPDAKILEHVDALFEIREKASNWLVFRTKLHTHSEPMQAEFTFLEPGQYKVRIVAFQAYPQPDAVAFVPVVKTWDVEAKDPVAPVTGPGGFKAEAGDGRYMLLHTYDPAPPGPNYDGTPVVGPFGNVRLNVLVYDTKEKRLVPHVDLEATLINAADQVLFQSHTLHEYDGHYEVVTSPGLVGNYRLQVTATQDDWKASKELSFQVATSPLAVVPGINKDTLKASSPCAGPVSLTVTGQDAWKLDEATRIDFLAAIANKDPCMHSEIELQWLDAAGVPLLINKLHTHSDGRFAILALPQIGGEQKFYLDAETLDGEASTSFEPAVLSFTPTFSVPSQSPIPVVATGNGGALPSPALPAILLALGLLIVLRGRRDRA